MKTNDKLLVLAGAIVVTVLVVLLVALSANATSQTWADLPCAPSGSLNICPPATKGDPYSQKLVGRDGSGCWPFDTFNVISGSATPPGITLDSSGLLHGTPSAVGTFDFWVNMQDVVTPSDTWCLPKSYQRDLEITVLAPPPDATPPVPYWELLAGTRTLHSELAKTYADGTTGLGNMIRWELANKPVIRANKPVTLTEAWR